LLACSSSDLGPPHSARLEFVTEDEIRGTWNRLSHGKPDEQSATFPDCQEEMI
jgi:hypothetical protein